MDLGINYRGNSAKSLNKLRFSANKLRENTEIVLATGFAVQFLCFVKKNYTIKWIS